MPNITPNTIKTNSVLKVLFVPSQGEIEGFPDTTNPLKCVYFGNTPVQNADGSFNINNVELAARNGTASQEKISGFTDAATSYTLNEKVTTSTPRVYTTTTGDPDSIRVTIRIPALFEQKDNGDTVGTEIHFKIYTKLGAGAYSEVRDIVINEKSSGQFDLDFLIPRPIGTTGVWSVKVERITADNVSLSMANDIYFQIATEIIDVDLAYPNNALVAIKTTSENTGTQIPIISFDLKGLLLEVPSNYTVSTRDYDETPAWDGTFKGTREWCDNPVWFLYTLLVDEDWGMGSIISAADIDQYSFYEAAKYCDELVPALNENGAVDGTEPRYTFNYQYLENADPWKFVQNVAASFGGVVYHAGSQIKILQDRPTDYSRIITNSNVEDGVFELTSNQYSSRFSAAIVYWNNPNENWLSVPAYYEDSTAVSRYGYNLQEVTGLGVTTLGQAMRMAKSIVESSISNTDVISFKVGYKNAGIEVGEVVAVMDTNWAEVNQEAVVVSSTATTVTLDRPVTVTSGDTFDVVAGDASGLETRTISSTGTLTTITYSGGAITAIAGADFLISGAVEPRLFKVTEVREDKPGIYAINAQFYDPNKFGRIDDTPVGPTPVYALQPDGYVVSPVSAISFTEEAVIDPNGNPVHYLRASWSPNANELITGYRVIAYLDNGDPINFGVLDQPFVRGQVPVEGTVKVVVYAINQRGKESLPTVGTHTLGFGGVSDLDPVTDLENAHGGSTTAFEGQDLTIIFTNPATNVVDEDHPLPLKDFEVRVKDGGTLKNTYYLPAVAAGATQSATYTLAMNIADNGGTAIRAITVEVRCRDAKNNLSSATTATFTNAAPAVPASIADIAIPNGLVLEYDAVDEPDVVGYGLHWSYSSPIVPSASTLILLGNTTSTTFQNFTPSTTVYYKVFAYDTFNTQADLEAGTNVNLSTEQTVGTDTYTAPPLLSVHGSGMVFGFDAVDSDTATTPTLTFDAILENTTGTVTWTVTAYDGAGGSLGTLTLGGSGNTGRTLTGSNFNSLGATTTRTVVVKAELGALEDQVTVYRIDGGSDYVQAGLSNEAHTLPANSAGTVSSYSGSGTEIYVAQGNVLLAYDGVGTSPGTWKIVATPTNITTGSFTDSGDYVTVGNHSAMTADNATISYAITGQNTFGTAFSITKVQSFAKSKQGADSTVYFITAPGAILQPVDNGTFSPTALAISSSSVTGTGSPSSYAGRFIIATSTDGSSYTNQYTSASDESSKSWTIAPETTNYVRVRLYQAGGTSTLLDEEVIPVVNTGNNAITVVVRNDTVSLPADSSGTVSSYSNSGVVIEVYEGSQAMTYNSSLGVGIAGKFTIGSPTVVAGTVTVPSPAYSGTGTTAATTGNLSAMSTDTAQIRWPITVWRFDKAVGDYDAGTYYAYQNVAKAKQGATGSTGATGTRGSVNLLLTGGSAPLTDAEANAAILADTGSSTKVVGDMVTETGSGGYISTKRWNGSAWAAPGTVIDGSLIVTETIATSALAAGSITTAKLASTAIDGMTITGATIRTASSGARVELSSNTLKATNSGGSNLIEFDNTGKALFTGGVYDPTGSTNYGAVVARVGTATNTSAIVGFYGYNEKASGGQAIKGESTSGNSSGVGVYGLAAHSSSTGVYAQNSSGQALLALGRVDFNLYTSSSSEFRLHNTTKHIRLKTAVPGATTGYGVIIGNDDTELSFGVTASGSSESSASTTPLTLQLSSGEVRHQCNPGSGGQIRLKTGTGTSGYGLIMRHDGSNFFLLKTSSGSADSTWTSDRPLTYNFSANSMTIENFAMRGMTIGTGAATATFGGTNKPGSNSSNTWLTIVINSTTYYIPIWT